MMIRHFFSIQVQLLVFLTGIGCQLAGQKCVLFEKNGNTWCRKERMVVEKRTLPDMDFFPAGEIPLRRLKKTTRQFTTSAENKAVPASVLILNKDGIPFKNVTFTWFGDSLGIKNKQPKWAGDSVLHFDGTAVVKFKTRMNTAVAPGLQIKPSFSLNRQTAILQVRSDNLTVLDTFIYTTDSLIMIKSKAPSDTLVNCFLSKKGGKKVLYSWQKMSVDTNSGISSRQSGLFHLVPKPGKKALLSEGIVYLLPRLWRQRIVPFKDFRPNDTLIFTVQAQGGRKMRHVLLKDNAGNQVAGKRNVTDFSDTLVVTTQSTYSLHLKGIPGLKKQYAKVMVERIRPVNMDSFYIVSDTVWQTKSNTTYDTMLVTVLQDSLHLTPIWNNESEPTAGLEVVVPQTAGKGAQLSHIAYWVGVGKKCIDQYQDVESTVPAEWSKPGAPTALGAFILKHPLLLPAISAPDVVCAFTKTRGKKLIAKGALLPAPADLLPDRTNAAVLSENELQNIAELKKNPATGAMDFHFNARFQNGSTVNTYPVVVMVVACYIKKTTKEAEPVEVKNETHQTRFPG